ncbi:MAG TPA: DUF2946 family protein [Steroidobacteraceae bacterium]|nr:DUF2946 family protein [Steroidobacteraceae bacterium]
MATTRARLIWAVLLAFALRALIPLGFMPAGDGSLSLMICPGGLPAGLLPGTGKSMPMSGGTPMPQPQHHGRGLMSDAYCVFTTGFGSAPPPLLPTSFLLLLALTALIAVMVLAPAGIRLVHLPQARAPPDPR